MKRLLLCLLLAACDYQQAAAPGATRKLGTIDVYIDTTNSVVCYEGVKYHLSCVYVPGAK